MNGEGLKDIRGPVAIPGDLLWLWILAVAAAVAVVVIVLLRRRRGSSAALPAVVRPPWDIALEELAAMEKEERQGEGRIKWFYSRLSEIVRVYLERRFDIRAPEMTTEEFLEKARSSPALNDAQKVALQDLLNASDLVKFAKTIPAVGDMEEALRLARRFVTETTPLPPVDARTGT